MNKKTYAEATATQVREILGDDYEVSIHEVAKNNGVIKTGISIMAKGENIAPTIYIDEIMADGKTTEMAAKEVVRVYKANTTINVKVTDIIEIFNNEALLLDKVMPRLVNANQPSENISVPFLDMKIIFTIKVIENGYITLKKRNVDIDPQRLLKAAIANMKKTVVRNMADIIPIPMGANDMVMKVITNEDSTFGAINMIDEYTLLALAEEVNDDLCILPSSIHEVIVVPFSEVYGNPLVDMVRNINATVVAPEEVLSNNVYIYRKETNTYEIM
jgi:hypothetical protein